MHWTYLARGVFHPSFGSLFRPLLLIPSCVRAPFRQPVAITIADGFCGNLLSSHFRSVRITRAVVCVRSTKVSSFSRPKTPLLTNLSKGTVQAAVAGVNDAISPAFGIPREANCYDALPFSLPESCHREVA